MRCVHLALFFLQSAILIYSSATIQSATLDFHRNDYGLAAMQLRAILDVSPVDRAALKLLAQCHIKLDQYDLALNVLARVIELENWSEPETLVHAILATYNGKGIEHTIPIMNRAITSFPENFQILLYSGIVHRSSGNIDISIELFKNAINSDSTQSLAWRHFAEALIELKSFEEAIQSLNRAISKFPNNPDFYFLLGCAYHHMNNFDIALQHYDKAKDLSHRQNTSTDDIDMNVAALYQMLGLNNEALDLYHQLYITRSKDEGFLNNYGTLLISMNQGEEGVHMLQQSLAINPKFENALINLGSFYQDEGYLNNASQVFGQAMQVSAQKDLIKFRIVLLLHPVSTSWEDMLSERSSVTLAVTQMLEERKKERNTVATYSAVHTSFFDRIHFFVVYHGLNDRPLQELIARCYNSLFNDLSTISPYASPSLATLHGGAGERVESSPAPKNTPHIQKIRIGFLSKFFGIFEPHGMLLDGVLKYLPRHYFEVYLLPITRADPKILSPILQEAADHILDISLSLSHAVGAVSSLKLDILVFADTLSEPMTHFMAHARMASVQVAFWGNPVTSGSLQMDYFVSSDTMEHPYQTRLSPTDLAYTEQLVLMPGQGIWYYPPDAFTSKNAEVELSNAYTREMFSLAQDWFVFMCPQSVFKMHPSFDYVITEILRRNPQSRLVITTGRKTTWTDAYLTRLGNVAGDISDRIIAISRVSADKFLDAIKIADVILHPFPFDGSRTAADALAVGIPFVTLPTEYLRGRMGMSLLRTMNISELVARNLSEYIDISTRLCQDKVFLRAIKARVEEKSHLIWEDMHVPFSWAQFLTTVSGGASLTWEQFLDTTDRNKTHEISLSQTRRDNQASFDATWGQETWLLDSGRLPHLPSMLPSGSLLPVFCNWNYSQGEFRTETKNIYSEVSQAENIAAVPKDVVKEDITPSNNSVVYPACAAQLPLLLGITVNAPSMRTVQDCVEVALEYMELPNIENGGLYVLLLSSVKWSDLALTLLRDVEKKLITQRKLVWAKKEHKFVFSSRLGSTVVDSQTLAGTESTTSASKGTDSDLLFKEILRTQLVASKQPFSPLDYVYSLLDCMRGGKHPSTPDKHSRGYVENAFALTTSAISRYHRVIKEKRIEFKLALPLVKDKDVILVVPLDSLLFGTVPHTGAQQNPILLSSHPAYTLVLKNLVHPCVSKVLFYHSLPVDFTGCQMENKIMSLQIDNKDLTLKYLLEVVNDYISSDAIVIVAKSYVFFDYTLCDLVSFGMNTRWNTFDEFTFQLSSNKYVGALTLPSNAKNVYSKDYFSSDSTAFMFLTPIDHQIISQVGLLSETFFAKAFHSLNRILENTNHSIQNLTPLIHITAVDNDKHDTTDSTRAILPNVCDIEQSYITAQIFM